MEETEKAYWNSEVSKILGVGESTLRKWCISLEKNGYEFLRGKKDSRAFTQHDLNALTYFKDLTKVAQYKIDQASIKVVEKFGQRNSGEENGRTVSVPDNYLSSIDEIKTDVKTLLELYSEQMEFNKVLINKLSERDKQIEFIQSQLEEIKKEQVATIEEGTLIETSSDEENLEVEEPKKKRMVERFKSLFKK
ncbi:hypothetical protein SFC08_16855 [Lysinibacillus halotolerans]